MGWTLWRGQYYYSLHQLGHVTDAHNLSAAQVRGIEAQQLAELWGDYGNGGNLSEVWFDGSIDGEMRPAIRSLLQKLQPHAMVFNSCGGTGFFPGNDSGPAGCVTPNAIRDTRTEAGAVGNPNWYVHFGLCSGHLPVRVALHPAIHAPGGGPFLRTVFIVC